MIKMKVRSGASWLPEKFERERDEQWCEDNDIRIETCNPRPTDEQNAAWDMIGGLIRMVGGSAF